MPGYDLLEDFHAKAGDTAVSSAPDWCMAVIRFQNPLTYDRRTKKSFSTIFGDAVKIRGKPLILRDECLSLQVSNSKTSHLTTLNATLIPTGLNLLAEILPGDWIFAWMAHQPGDIDKVIQKVLDGKAANGFGDGLKFMGRVGGVRKQTSQSPGGIKTTRYTLSASGFTEFDATLFYEPHLAENIPAIGQYFAKLTAHLDKLIDANGQGITVNKALRLFLDLLLGQGVPQNLGLPSEDPDLRSTAGLDAPYSYVVPKEVGAIIGKVDSSKPDLLSAADILEFVYGRQEYEDQEFAASSDVLIDQHDSGSQARAIAQRLNPMGTKGGGSRRFTGNDMLGIFLPTPPQFSNHSVWSVLNQYLNPAVNEMYTCLRVNPNGDVVPTLIARQIPFSSELAPGYPAVTKFLSLPRWRVHPLIVRREDIGRSEAQRINFVHVYGDDGPQTMNPVAGQIVLAPPYRDDLDIARSGLKPYQQTIANSPTDNVDGEAAKQWMAIMSDILMGQQLTLTGLLEMYGIQSPICVGDNIEWEGSVFHIESVTHSCSMEGENKAFTTTLALSHGVSATPEMTNLGIFSGLKAEDHTRLEPGITHDSRYTYANQSALATEGAVPEATVQQNEDAISTPGKSRIILDRIGR